MALVVAALVSTSTATRIVLAAERGVATVSSITGTTDRRRRTFMRNLEECVGRISEDVPA